MATEKTRSTQMDGYVRVSRRMGREGPGYISPSVQREAIERWAAYRGIEIVEWHVDEDESGGTQDRPGIRAAIERVANGETGGVACWKLNRFARNVAEALQDVATVQDAGGMLAFTEDDIDATGPAGEFFLTVLLAVAALDLNNLKLSWRIAKERAMNRGAIVGPTPFGYARADAGVLIVDVVTGLIVTEAFAVAAEQGLHACVDFLNERCAPLPERVRGELGRGGQRRTWTTSTVRRLLSNRAYLGEFIYGELRHTDPELALVRSSVWHAAQPDEPKRRRPKAQFPLSGLARCGTCGAHLVGNRAGYHKDGTGRRGYRCAASMGQWKGERCPEPTTVLAELLEAYVRDEAAIAAESLTSRFVDSGELGEALTAAERELADAELELDEFASDLTARRRLGDRYHEYLGARVDDVDAKQARVAELAGELAKSGFDDGDVAQLIRDAQLEELGVLLRGMLTSVVVARGRGPIADRVRFVPLEADPPTRMPPAQDR